MYCFNSRCPKPQNPEKSRFCQSCGARLLLGDRYRGFSSLGSGNSSRTVLGLDTHQLLDPRCIVKGFAAPDEADDSQVERFRQEAARLAVISEHPQLPDLLAYFERDYPEGETALHRQQFVVQEFVDGRNLLKQLSDEGTFDEAQILQLLRDVLPVLQFLHDHQIIHRDVKPANLIRRSSDETLMLVDYGAVKVSTQSVLGKTGTVMGSAEYAAPEQLIGKAVFASDLYGLGVTCIHLLTGLRPFELYNSATGIWFWQSAAGTVSNRLSTVIDKLLQATLNQRYSSAAQVLNDLDMTSALICPPVSPSKAIAQFQPPPPQTWEETCTLTHPAGVEVNALIVDPTHNILISGSNDGAVNLWDVAEQRHLTRLIETQGAIAALALSPDTNTIATGSWDDTLKVWNRQGELLHTLTEHQADVTCVAIHPSGQHLLSGSRDKTLYGWDLQTGQSVFCFKGHKAAIEAIAISPDGQFVASGDAQGSVKIWHWNTKELLRTLPKHAATIGAIILHPKLPLIVTSGWDMAVQVRNLHTGGVQHTLTGHLLPVTSASFSPDGKTIATGSHDTTIKLWDLDQGTLLSTLTGHTAAVEAIAFLPENALASASKDGTIKLWHRQNN